MFHDPFFFGTIVSIKVYPECLFLFNDLVLNSFGFKTTDLSLLSFFFCPLGNSTYLDDHGPPPSKVRPSLVYNPPFFFLVPTAFNNPS